MSSTEKLVLLLLGGVVVAAMLWLFRGRFSAEARERRRRRRSYGRVVSRAKRPMVKLAVNTDESKPDR
jgi:hypothetical protein